MNIDSILNEEYKRVEERGAFGVPNHYVVNLTDENMKDEFLYELTTAMADRELRPFHALDRWLYFSLDGSKERLLTYKGIIQSSAVYDNYFEGVLAFDASALILPVNSEARETFYNIVSSTEFSQHATIIIFLSEMTSDNAKHFLLGLGKRLEYKNVEFKQNEMRFVYEK